MNKQQKIIFFILAVSLAIVLSGGFWWKNAARKVVVESGISSKDRKTVPLKAVSFISPHHLVAEKLIENIFQKTSEVNKDAEIKRVILLSPNHENIGRGWGIVADKNWNTKNGIIENDPEAVKIILARKDLFALDNNAFSLEHGILDLLPFVKKYFPEARVVPIMLQGGLPSEKAAEIAELLAKNFGAETIVALSADFSHYIGKTASTLHDEKSIEAMENFDYAKIQKLDVDCRGGLEMVERFSEKLGFGKFNLLENSNSSEIYGQDFGEKNTSYVTGYFSQGEKTKSIRSTSILFLGDLMLDRDMRTLIAKRGIGWPTEKIERLFWSQDLNVANLEGPITANPSVSFGSSEDEKRHFVFTFDSNGAKAFLQKNNINAVSIGNNHILNFKTEGLNETKNALALDKVDYFGDPLDKNNYFLKNIDGRKIGIVNYNQFSGIDVETVTSLVKELKSKSDFVMVYAHWGREYQLKEDESQREKAHQFIDAGADLIVGSHPHVAQPMEIYKNKAIFYSLGNFIFDQYFSEDVKTRLALGAVLNGEKINFYLVPLYLEKNGQLSILDGEKKRIFLERFSRDSRVDNSVKSEIMNSRIELINN